jgi:hypothetical protein
LGVVPHGIGENIETAWRREGGGAPVPSPQRTGGRRCPRGSSAGSSGRSPPPRPSIGSGTTAHPTLRCARCQSDRDRLSSTASSGRPDGESRGRQPSRSQSSDANPKRNVDEAMLPPMCWPHRRRRRSADEPVRRGDADTEQPQPPCGGGREGCRRSRRGSSTRRRRRVRSERGRRRRLVEGDRLGTPKAVREPGGRGGHAVRLRSPRRIRPFTLRRRIHLSNSGSGGRDLSRSRLTAMSGPDPGAIQRSTTKLRSGVLPLPAEATPTSRPGLWACVVPVGMSPSDDSRPRSSACGREA